MTAKERRQIQLKKKRMRRLKRRLKAYAVRVLFLSVLFFLCVLVIQGGLLLLKGSEKVEDVFQGARIVENKEEERAEGSPLIVLDAGHGGRDQGTSSGKALEKEINLSVVQKLAQQLENAGAAVLLTREDDTKIGLNDRADYANQNQAEYFVSLHCNYCEEDAGVKGLECYYRDGSAAGKALAEQIVQKMDSEEQISCRGTRIGDFRVLNNTEMPAVLVEMGYLSNRGECAKLTEEEYQKLLAKKLAEGILAVVSPQP